MDLSKDCLERFSRTTSLVVFPTVGRRGTLRPAVFDRPQFRSVVILSQGNLELGNLPLIPCDSDRFFHRALKVVSLSPHPLWRGKIYHLVPEVLLFRGMLMVP